MKRFIPLAALAALLPAAAAANPVFLPARDVAVTYSLTAPGRAPSTYQLAYDAADQLARVESQNGYYVLANLPQGQAQVVVPALRAVVQAPDFSALTGEIYNADGAQFTPVGKGHYAGLDCEKYLVLDKNATGTACITPSGVILHFSGHDANGSADVTALSVSYAPQPAENFVPPAGFSPVDLPPGALLALLKGQ
ncbi:hypothetical protein [Acidocella aromatica]|uniref:Uncharacterized protein n=1 Tax=Acidocella aromatica TaxID=1303579 RepID=A0A840VKA6_9PROT|nr:hypothetical protein [Acidocella aromatica]MBB5373605.1 hypothetical protein [Acidocella aromatica]